MSDGVGQGTAIPGQSRAVSEDTSRNANSNGFGINTNHSGNPEDGETNASSSDSGFQHHPYLAILEAAGSPIRRGLKPTGVCYDDRMKLHMNVDWDPHDHHPEDPERISEIFNSFKEHGLVYTGRHEDLPQILKDSPNKYMYRIAARDATKEEICSAHSPDHYDWVESLSRMSYQELRILTKQKDSGRDSLYVGAMSYKAALLSAGGAIETTKLVVEGVLKNAFAVIRPPGHHAEYDHAMGFCFFNNVPVAVRVCQKLYPQSCRKVLILDWDVHHGNGVQNIFYEDPNVLYISLHVYQDGSFYPGKPDNPMMPDGGIEHCGTGLGLGKNINIGWLEQGMGDGEYMAAFQKIIMPIAKEFDPDLVVISAGFDAAQGDELGGCFVTPACYAHMTHMLMSLADGKLVVCLEGGYNLKAISQSAVAVAQTLMGEPPPRMKIPSIDRDVKELIAKVAAYQAPHWQCMRQGVISQSDVNGLNAVRLHELIRDDQQRKLMTKHKMVPLHIQRESIFNTFENQVLVTSRFELAPRLLIIIHDPPQLLAQPNVDNTLEPHNTYVVDEVVQYIDWAVANGFAVMDINLPSQPEYQDEPTPYIANSTEKDLEARVQTLITYLWDNYLQLCPEMDIFLMGVGDAHVGVKSFLTCRDTKDRVSGVVNFVKDSLKAIKSDIFPDLSGWYKENSLVYASIGHRCWSDPESRRRVTKRRYGHVVKSPADGITKMMHLHAEDAMAWILDRVNEESGDTTEDEVMA